MTGRTIPQKGVRNRTCVRCGAPFSVKYPSSANKYCSRDCVNASLEKGKRWTCLACGKQFKPANYDPGAKFCSKACWYEWHQGDRHGQFNQIELTCEWCGDVFHRNPFEVAKSEHHYCGQSCAAKAHSLKMRGMAEGEPQQASYYALSGWRTARMKALERDQFMCIECGMDENEHRIRYRTGLHVDHIVPRRHGGGDDMENLQTMCCKCHNHKTQSGV